MKLQNILLKNALPGLLLCGCLAAGPAACGFLDTEPHNFTSPAQFYRNQEDCEQALAGIYWTLASGDVYGDGFSTKLFNVDDLSYTRARTADNAANNTHFTSNETVYQAWSALYKGIDNANMLLQHIDDADITEEDPQNPLLRNAIKGEARFLRAYFYFLLVQNWYEVPVRMETVSDINKVEMAGMPHLEAMKWIAEEMEASLDLVDDTRYDTSPSHVKKTTVEGVLARVYLWRAGYNRYKPDGAEALPAERISEFYAAALKYAKAVRNSGKHQLVPTAGKPENIELIWRNMCSDQYETRYNESMWEVEFAGAKDYTQGKIGAFLGNQQDDPALGGVGFAYSYYKGTRYLWDLFAEEKGDLRRDLSMAPYFLDKNGKRKEWPDNKITARACGKFRREWETFYPKAKNYTTVNFPLLRYADVLLMIAEAGNELREADPANLELAYSALNEVRTRAGVSVYAGLDQAAFRQKVMDERARELCFEAVRKGDLVRWGLYYAQVHDRLGGLLKVWDLNKEAAELYVRSTSEKHRFLPIPLSELAVNGTLFHQNAFWD